MVTDMRSKQKIVIVGAEGNLGRDLSSLYARAGDEVVNIQLSESTDLDAIAASCGMEPIDLLIFADNLDLADASISGSRRDDMQNTMQRLTYAPFRLATLLRPALAAARGNVVLYSRATSVMERPEAGGRFTDRPFRAAAHALWRCLAIEWQEDGIDFLIVALSEPSDPTQLARQPDVVEMALTRGRDMLLVDDAGLPLAW